MIEAIAPSSHRPGGAAWIETPFQATVRGMAQGGERFTLDTVLDGLSPSYLALRLPYEVEPEQSLFFVVWLRVPAVRGIAGSGVAVRGRVVCSEARPGNVWRVTAALTRQRFLYARAS